MIIIHPRLKPLCPFCVSDKDSTVKDNKSKDHSYFEEFTLWILIKHMNIQSRITPLCHFYFDFVIKLQQSKIAVNKSKDSSYFEEFTLWILIKHMNIQSRITPLCHIYFEFVIKIQLSVIKIQGCRRTFHVNKAI